jgi:hypothetical protein
VEDLGATSSNENARTVIGPISENEDHSSSNARGTFKVNEPLEATLAETVDNGLDGKTGDIPNNTGVAEDSFFIGRGTGGARDKGETTYPQNDKRLPQDAGKQFGNTPASSGPKQVSSIPDLAPFMPKTPADNQSSPDKSQSDQAAEKQSGGFQQALVRHSVPPVNSPPTPAADTQADNIQPELETEPAESIPVSTKDKPESQTQFSESADSLVTTSHEKGTGPEIGQDKTPPAYFHSAPRSSSKLPVHTGRYPEGKRNTPTSPSKTAYGRRQQSWTTGGGNPGESPTRAKSISGYGGYEHRKERDQHVTVEPEPRYRNGSFPYSATTGGNSGDIPDRGLSAMQKNNSKQASLAHETDDEGHALSVGLSDSSQPNAEPNWADPPPSDSTAQSYADARKVDPGTEDSHYYQGFPAQVNPQQYSAQPFFHQMLGDFTEPSVAVDLHYPATPPCLQMGSTPLCQDQKKMKSVIHCLLQASK